MTEIELLITLDRMRSAIESIDKRLATAEANDKRFEAMEHDFRVAKWFAMAAGGAAIVATVVGIAGRISWRSEPPPAPSSSAERMGSDRVAPPTPPPLQGR